MKPKMRPASNIVAALAYGLFRGGAGTGEARRIRRQRRQATGVITQIAMC
jgi:hypothetical protein